jgi:hypothetical protein
LSATTSIVGRASLVGDAGGGASSSSSFEPLFAAARAASMFSRDSGFNIPAICQPGSTCTSNTYKMCQSQAPGSCDVDSDCPSTWTCGCEAEGLGGSLVLADASMMTGASCTKVCLAPNSDLAIFGGENGAGGSFGPAGTGVGVDAGAVEGAGVPSPGDDTPKAGAPPAGNSSGGRAVGGGGGGGDCLWAPIGGLLVAVRRRSRKRALA